MGSVRGVLRVPFVGWLVFHSLMYDPPSPLFWGTVFGLLFTKGCMDGFNRRIFSYYFVFYSIFIGYLICVLVVLMLKVYMAVVRVKLEPYLEFLHSARA
jgi:hypothetical protein